MIHRLIGLLSLLGLVWTHTTLAVTGAGPEYRQASEPANFGLDQTTALQFSQSVIGKPIGDYTLTDRLGRPVRLSQYRGKPLLVSFIYTGCTQVCLLYTSPSPRDS